MKNESVTSRSHSLNSNSLYRGIFRAAAMSIRGIEAARTDARFYTLNKGPADSVFTTEVCKLLLCQPLHHLLHIPELLQPPLLLQVTLRLFFSSWIFLLFWII